MGRTSRGGWDAEPPFDYGEVEHRPHYGLWGLALGSIAASFLVARSQGKSMGGVLLRGALSVIAIYALIMIFGAVIRLFVH